MKKWLLKMIDLVYEQLSEETLVDKSPLEDQDREAVAGKTALAYAVLLVDLALVDQRFSIREHAFVKSKLREVLGLSLDEVYALIDRADEIVRETDHADTYAMHLSEVLSAELREQLVVVLDELLHVDGRAGSFETGLRDRYQMLLGVRVAC